MLYDSLVKAHGTHDHIPIVIESFCYYFPEYIEIPSIQRVLNFDNTIGRSQENKKNHYSSQSFL